MQNTITMTKTNGIPVWYMHSFNYVESSVSIHPLNVRMEDIMISVKKNLCSSTPKESRCHAIRPSFFTKMSLKTMKIMKGMMTTG